MPKTTSATDTKAAMIKVIFTNLLFVIGVILLIVGFVQGASTTAKLLIFEKYPLNSYEESRCDANSLNMNKPILAEGESQPAISDAELERQKAECNKQLEFDRKVRKTEDVVGSISFLVAGAILSLVFKRFIWEKLS